MIQRASGGKRPMVMLTAMGSMPLLRVPREEKLQYLLLQLEEFTCMYYYAQQVCIVAVLHYSSDASDAVEVANCWTSTAELSCAWV